MVRVKIISPSFLFDGLYLRQKALKTLPKSIRKITVQVLFKIYESHKSYMQINALVKVIKTSL